MLILGCSSETVAAAVDQVARLLQVPIRSTDMDGLVRHLLSQRQQYGSTDLCVAITFADPDDACTELQLLSAGRQDVRLAWLSARPSIPNRRGIWAAWQCLQKLLSPARERDTLAGVASCAVDLGASIFFARRILHDGLKNPLAEQVLALRRPRPERLLVAEERVDAALGIMAMFGRHASSGLIEELRVAVVQRIAMARQHARDGDHSTSSALLADCYKRVVACEAACAERRAALRMTASSPRPPGLAEREERGSAPAGEV
jgi:hypothetical protein